jgi:hypothetical protein
MPVQQITATIDGINTGLMALGAGSLILTLAAGSLCLYFAWFDTHIGALIKRVLLCCIAGSAGLGGTGLLGHWIASMFGL